MKYGCCIPLGSFVPNPGNENNDGIKYKDLYYYSEIIKSAGYDFIELTVGFINSLPESELEKIALKSAENSIKIPVANSFVPSSLPIIGEKRDLDILRAHIEKSMKRLKFIGGEYIVLGSGGARKVPEGYDKNRAKSEFCDFLFICGEYAEKYAIKVLIEPLNKKETNLANTLEESYEFVEKLNSPYIQLLCDSYHLSAENEAIENVSKYIKNIKHVHIAEAVNRKYPGYSGGEYVREFLTVLKNSSYDSRVSVECLFGDFETEILKSIEFVRGI